MLDTLERRCLLALALDCRRRGLDATETNRRMRQRLGAMINPGRRHCAIRHFFATG